MSRLVHRSIIAGLAILAASSAVASADIVDRRQYNQQQRIQDGVRNGSITRQEYIELQREQARIADLERRAKADGRIDRREAYILDRAQDNASRHIAQEKHDRDNRRWGGWGFRRWW